MEIVPDPLHALLLTLPFAVSLGAVYFILWQPLLAYLDERTAVGARARHEANDLHAAADQQVRQIEARLSEARNTVGVTRQQSRARALAHEADTLAEARARADSFLAEAIEQLEKDKEQAAAELRGTASELSHEITRRVLGRQVG